MSNFTTASFSGAGVASVVEDAAPQLKVRHIVSATPVAGGETLTITHGSDVNKIRRVAVLSSGGVDFTNNVLITSVTRTSATVTTIVFAAGTGSAVYTVVIEF